MEWDKAKKYSVILNISTREEDDEGNTWTSEEGWPLLTEVTAPDMEQFVQMLSYAINETVGHTLQGCAIRDHIDAELKKLTALFQ